MSPDDLQTKLEASVGANFVIAETPAARRDTGKPAYVVRPSSAAEVAELVRVASSESASVIPVGTGMRDALAEPDPGRPRVFIDLQRLNHVLRLDETSLVVHVQAGLTAIELEQILAKRGLSLGDYPPSSLGSTIGGLLAVRTPGKLSYRHGFIEDAVLGLSAVLCDGRTIHTRIAPRRATGPDLARALCGSEGTLGIITSAVIRIHRRPETRFLTAYSLPTLEDAVSAVHLGLREDAAPAALRAYDHEAARVHYGDEAPEDAALLLVATAGPTDLAACDRDLLASAVEAVGGQPAEGSLAEGWWKARVGLQDPLRSPHLQVSAKPGTQKPVYAAARAAADEMGIVIGAYASRFDLDGAVLFFTLMDENRSPLEGKKLVEARDALLLVMRDAGAYLLGTTYLPLDPYFQRLRSELDPDAILNPGALSGDDEGPN